MKALLRLYEGSFKGFTIEFLIVCLCLLEKIAVPEDTHNSILHASVVIIQYYIAFSRESQCRSTHAAPGPARECVCECVCVRARERQKVCLEIHRKSASLSLAHTLSRMEAMCM